MHISALRKLVGPASIATIPGRGYQFAARLDVAVATPPTAPESLSPLYGRDADIDNVCALLEPHALVSIVGAPGIGKTRLAHAVARHLRDRYADGAWTVELAGLMEAALVPATVARALGIPMQERPSASGVAGTMKGLVALVVIDNCEHLLYAVGEMVEALRARAPSVKVLTTSQAPLRASSEHVFRVSALAVPPSLEAQEPLRYAAVELFCARAQAADPRFALTDANGEAVMEICRRLDGIPLAIELAAARLRLLGVEGLRARLDDRLRLFTTGLTHALPKQQTLAAAIEWSHGLLSPAERVMFRRLGIFAGRFTLEAAQQVAIGDGIDAWSVLDHLGTLVDRSLVTVGGDATPRYRMLESTRLFAMGQLSASGEAATIRRAHALATLAVLEYVDERAWTMTGPMLHAYLEPELDNVRAALAWAQGAEGDPSIGVALVAKSAWLWESVNLVGEGIARTAALERCVDDSLPLELRAAYWRARTFPHWGLGVGVDAKDMATHAIELTRRVNDPHALFDALNRSIIGAARAGQAEHAHQQLAEAQELERESWPARQRATGRWAHAYWLEAMDRLQEAHTAQEQRIALLMQAGESGVQLHAQSQLVTLEGAIGDIDAAVARGRRVMVELAPQFPPFRSRWLMVSLAQVLVSKGLMDEAVLLAERAVPLMKGAAAQWQTLDMLAQLWARGGNTVRAAQLLGCADAMYRLHRLVRAPHAARARTALLSTLADALSAEMLGRALCDGEALTEEDAIALAMAFERRPKVPAPPGFRPGSMS